MYHDPQSSGLLANIQNAGGLKTPVSPMQSLLNEHGDSLDKLGALFSDLEQRLLPIRNQQQTTEAGVPDNPQPMLSPLVDQLSRQQEMVLHLQGRMRQLMGELEV